MVYLDIGRISDKTSHSNPENKRNISWFPAKQDAFIASELSHCQRIPTKPLEK